MCTYQRKRRLRRPKRLIHNAMYIYYDSDIAQYRPKRLNCMRRGVLRAYTSTPLLEGVTIVIKFDGNLYLQNLIYLLLLKQCLWLRL
jgi:hypothetical protein